MADDDITIRDASASDIEALQRVIQSAYRGPLAAATWSHEGELPMGERITCAQLADLLEAPDCQLLVMEHSGQLVGSALVAKGTANHGLIGLLSVAPDQQGRGWGSRLLDHAENEAVRRFGVTRTALEVLEHKRRLVAYYERRGYSRTGASRPYPHKLAAPATFIMLSKQLES